MPPNYAFWVRGTLVTLTVRHVFDIPLVTATVLATLAIGFGIGIFWERRPR